MAETLGDATLKLRADSKNLEQGLAKAKKSMMAIGAAMTAVGGAITAPMAAGVKIFMEYEQNMANVKAVSNATEQEFAALNAIAKEMGATTVFTARESAEALAFMSMAGMKAGESVNALPDVLNLAAAGQLELGQAADIVTNVMAGYGIASDNLTGAVDVLTLGFTSANTNLVQLGDAFKYAGPVAKAAGLDFNETAAALALMGNAGFQGSMSGTALRGAITRLLKPTGEAADLIEQYGVNVYDSQGKMMPLVSILKSFEEGGLTAADAMTIFGQRAGPGMLALIEQGTGALSELTAEMALSAGTATRIATTQLDTMQGQFTLLKSALEGLALSIGEQLMPMIRDFVESVTPLIQGVIEWAKQNPELARTIIVVTGAVGALALVGGALLIAVSVLLGPIGLMALALAALVAVGVLVYRNWDTIRAKVAPIWDFVREKVTTVLDALTTAFRYVAEFSMPLIREAWNEHLKPTWEAIVKFGRNVLGPLIQDIGQFFYWLWKQIDDFLIAGLRILLVVFDTIWKSIVIVVETAVGVLGAIIRAVLAALSGDWKQGWLEIKKIGEEIWEGISAYWKLLTSSFGRIWNVVSGGLKSAWTRVWGWLKTQAGQIWKGMQRTWANVWDGIVNKVKGAINIVIGFINRMIGAWNSISFTIPQIDIPSVTIGGKFGIPEVTIGGGTFGGQSFGVRQLSRIPHLAEGGIVSSPTLAMIGERGPEAVIPLDRGAIGTVINVTVQGNVMNGEDFVERVQEAIILRQRQGVLQQS